MRLLLVRFVTGFACCLSCFAQQSSENKTRAILDENAPIVYASEGNGPFQKEISQSRTPRFGMNLSVLAVCLAGLALPISLALGYLFFDLKKSLRVFSRRLHEIELESQSIKNEKHKNAPNFLKTQNLEKISAEKSTANLPFVEAIAPAPKTEAPIEEFPEGYRRAGDVLRDIRKKMPRIFKEAAEQIQNGALPLYGWGRKEKVLVLPKEAEDQKWFFIGDIHGDFLALHRLLEQSSRDPDFYICFLGDLVDRGPCDLECFALLLETAKQHPGRVMWIAGNHDEGISFHPEAEHKFKSTVEPAEFLDLLNAPPQKSDSEKLESWGQLFIGTVAGLPRAALFPDGLLATHGGVPLEDRWPALKVVSDFENAFILGDFTWTRATTVPHKKGWQYDAAKRKTSSNFEFGYKDLEGFCKRVESFFPVKRLVRGHDHVESGWESPKEYKTVPMLTLNGFGFHYLSGSYENYADALILGIYRKNELPQTDFVTFSQSEREACAPQTLKN